MNTDAGGRLAAAEPLCDDRVGGLLEHAHLDGRALPARQGGDGPLQLRTARLCVEAGCDVVLGVRERRELADAGGTTGAVLDLARTKVVGDEVLRDAGQPGAGGAADSR